MTKKTTTPFGALHDLKGTGNKELAGDDAPETTPEPTPTPVAPSEQVLLSARIPLPLKREYDRRIFDFKDSRGLLRFVKSQMGIAAFIRLLRDPEISARWETELRKMVAEERQEQR